MLVAVMLVAPMSVALMNKQLWQPSAENIRKANITQFAEAMAAQHSLSIGDPVTDPLQAFNALHHWSVENKESFWSSFWDYSGVVASAKGTTVLVDADKMPGAEWFPDAKINFAENLLRHSGSEAAVVFRGEDKKTRSLSYEDLRVQTAAIAAVLKGVDVKSGDRVAAIIPNMPEAIIGMLGTASLGAVWSSCSPDFGVRGIVDRFGQIEPEVLFACDGYYYNGKFHSCIDKVKDVLKEVPSIKQVILVSMNGPDKELDGDFDCPVVKFREVVAEHKEAVLEFAQLPFNHPLYIMYSSGTTGVPKCIVHSAGGSLLQHLKEQRLHCDIRPGDRLFYFTTCGWMMWNWLVSGLASGATLMLFDGSPFYPDGNVLFDYIDDENINIFGTSAKYIDAVNKAGLEPIHTHNLSSVRSILSTGSPLAPESFSFVYEKVKKDVCLSSVSGGTDILGCFVGGNPTLPVHRGELQCCLLGMAVDVFDDDGNSVRNEKGELVCVDVFPSMPVGFWNDSDGQKYHQAYFDKYPNIWCHGDFVELTDRGSMLIHGRSDAVLNPGGVRIGTAEIYRQVEQLAEVVESLVIGQNWQSDVRVVLFVKLRSGVSLDEELQAKIKNKIRSNCTPRHVPAVILSVEDIPRTKSGKIVELAVRQVVHGEEIKNKEALANPEALEYFRNRLELQS